MWAVSIYNACWWVAVTGLWGLRCWKGPIKAKRAGMKGFKVVVADDNRIADRGILFENGYRAGLS